MTSIRGVVIPEETVRQLMQGNKSAQGEVYTVLAPHVYSMALRVLRDPQGAEDITQDTFIDVITKAHTIKSPNKFVGWVRTIAVNRCYMRLRSPWYKRRLDVELEDEVVEEDHTTGLDLERILESLDQKTRMVLWLYCVEGYTHEEIGKLMKRSTSYSKIIISRLSKRLNKTESNDDTEASTSTLQSKITNQWRVSLCP
ncbi:MAG: RNA polymerase sigma factor [Gammaproteobacteria bacterium]|nr:RNA polymerase sigma factor [Gammaproteobacteria bacterium]MYF53138.1 RNA polymerase sigma factor [Gammaproteobacteria bacterium]MYK42929.1 RNA polymerase sigma factor [Gammaproteobacteria bacterium]